MHAVLQPNFGDFIRNKLQRPKPKASRRKPDTSSSNSQHSNNTNRHQQRQPGSSNGRTVKGHRPPPASSSSNTARSGPISGGSSGALGSSSTAGAAGGAGCPLRQWLGPFAGVVFNKHDKLQCPQAIVQARAALARTEAVRKLRPQALHVKLATVAATAAALNIPCGAWREHFEKFSVGWFIAVHATIPFVAMLRKAVVMPKYAIVVTLAAAVAGQVIGSRLERQRLQAQSAEHVQKVLPAPQTSVAVPAPAPVSKPIVSADALRGIATNWGRDVTADIWARGMGCCQELAKAMGRLEDDVGGALQLQPMRVKC